MWLTPCILELIARKQGRDFEVVILDVEIDKGCHQEYQDTEDISLAIMVIISEIVASLLAESCHQGELD